MSRKIIRLGTSLVCMGVLAFSFQNCQPIENQDATAAEPVQDTIRGELNDENLALLQQDATRLRSLAETALSANATSVQKTFGCNLLLNGGTNNEKYLDLGQVVDAPTCDKLCARQKQVLQLSPGLNPQCVYTFGGGKPVAPRPERPRVPEASRFPKNTDFHAVAIYESSRDVNFNGAVNVHLTGKGPAVLLLSAYEKAEWLVTHDASVQLLAIYVNGYHAQKIKAKTSKNVLISMATFETTGQMLIEDSSFLHQDYPLSAAQQASNNQFILKLAARNITKPEHCVVLLKVLSNSPPNLQDIVNYSRCEQILSDLQFLRSAHNLTGLKLKTLQGDYTAQTSYKVKVSAEASEPVGSCIAQDTIRGGAQYANQTKAQCVATCKKEISEAPARARVYDCRWVSGAQDIIIQKGRAPVTVINNDKCVAVSGKFVSSQNGGTLAVCKTWCKEMIVIRRTEKDPLKKCSFVKNDTGLETVIYTAPK